MVRSVLAVAMVAALVSFFVFDIGKYVSLDSLNANRARLQEFVQNAPALSALLFGLIYATVTALSFPVATALTVLSGFLFGRVLGTALVDLAATIGATIAFVATRYVLRDWVERRLARSPDSAQDPAGPRAQRRQAAWNSVSEGIRLHGFNYLLVLRLLPIAPFFLINLISGLTAMPLRSFVLGTLIGILPGTFLYVNAGTTLGTLSRPADLLSLRVLGALGLLALFSLIPVMWRVLRRRYKRNV